MTGKILVGTFYFHFFSSFLVNYLQIQLVFNNNEKRFYLFVLVLFWGVVTGVDDSGIILDEFPDSPILEKWVNDLRIPPALLPTNNK